MWCTHSSSSHPAKLEKLSPSNCHREALNPVTCCCPLRCSPSRRPPAPLPGAGQGNLQSPRAGCFPSCLSSPTIPKEPKRLWQHKVSLKRSVGEAWKCVTGGRETLQWEEHQSEPALVLPEVAPSHHHPARAGRSILAWKTMGRQHLSSTGQPGEVSGDPGAGCDVAGRFTPARVVQAPTATMGGGCKRGPAPLVLPQLYYGGLSVGLIDVEPECTVQRLSVNYMWLSIYCFEHDLGLKHMNLLLVKTCGITFSWHQ